jgi:hypothetical protein
MAGELIQSERDDERKPLNSAAPARQERDDDGACGGDERDQGKDVVSQHGRVLGNLPRRLEMRETIPQRLKPAWERRYGTAEAVPLQNFHHRGRGEHRERHFSARRGEVPLQDRGLCDGLLPVCSSQ